MPNHVHIVIEMIGDHSLSKVVWSWKSFTAKQANAALQRSGVFWDVDYFDRYMRNEVEQNPVKAALCSAPGEWPWGSTRFREV
jgi:putative transposase